MIQETMTHACRVCKSTHIVKNGTSRCGNAQYHCKDCGTSRVLTPKQAYGESEQHTVLRACGERCRLGAVARIFAMARQTVARWLKAHVQKGPEVKETLLPAAADDVLELDAHLECCAEERAKTVGVDSDVPPNPPNRRLCHWRAKQSDLSSVMASHPAGIQALPHGSRDFWHVYQRVFPAETHHGVGKETGETAYMQRWNNTLRQRVGRYVRQTLSFSRIGGVS